MCVCDAVCVLSTMYQLCGHFGLNKLRPHTLVFGHVFVFHLLSCHDLISASAKLNVDSNSVSRGRKSNRLGNENPLGLNFRSKSNRVDSSGLAFAVNLLRSDSISPYTSTPWISHSFPRRSFVRSGGAHATGHVRCNHDLATQRACLTGIGKGDLT